MSANTPRQAPNRMPNKTPNTTFAVLRIIGFLAHLLIFAPSRLCVNHLIVIPDLIRNPPSVLLPLPDRRSPRSYDARTIKRLQEVIELRRAEIEEYWNDFFA
jgi:hypothetical protein